MAQKKTGINFNSFQYMVTTNLIIIIGFYILVLNSCQKSSPNPLKNTGTDSTKKNISLNLPKDSLYQVWLDLAITPENALTKSSTWSNTASLISGFDVNSTPLTPIPGTLSANELPLNDWPSFYQLNKQSAMQGLLEVGANTVISSTLVPANYTISSYLQNRFSSFSARGVEINMVMIYNYTANNSQYFWSTDSLISIKNWLNKNGHANAKIAYDIRNFTALDSAFAQNHQTDAILMEAAPFVWTQAPYRKEKLQWLIHLGFGTTKPLIFLLDVNSSATGNPGTPYIQQIREMVRWLGVNIGYKFLRNSNVIFIIGQYDYKIPFYPETTSTNQYNNSITGTALSILEQREYFEGYHGTVSLGFADSTSRTP